MNENLNMKSLNPVSWLPPSGKNVNENLLLTESEKSSLNLQRKIVPWLDNMLNNAETKSKVKFFCLIFF